MALTLSIAITQNSQSVANNTSNVTVKVNASWTHGSYNQLQKSGYLIIDGTKYTFTSSVNYNQTTSGSQTLFTKTVNVNHSSDGTKNLSCSAWYNCNLQSATEVTASASKTLTTIPRKSSLSASNGTLGTEQTLTVTRQSDTFTHTITYKCGSATDTICSKSSSTSIKWTPPLALAKQNTTGTSVSVTLTITTYNGGTSLGSNEKKITCSIPSSVKPTVSITVSDAAGYSSKYNSYVKGKSKLKVTITASGSQGSTIKSYSTKADGKTYSGSPVTTPVLVSTGTSTVSTTVTDSRGRTSTATSPISVLNYVSPKITSLSAWRCVSASNSTAKTDGAYIAVKFTSSATALNDKNSTEYVLAYKKPSESEYTTKTLTDFANTYSASGTVIFAADTSATYDIVMTVTDDFGSGSKVTAGGSTSKLFSILAKGKGIAIGKIAELADYLDVAFKTRFRSDIYTNNNVTIYGLKPDGTEVHGFQAQNTNGNTIVGWGNYYAKSGNTNIYGYDVNIGTSNIPNPTYYQPYVRQGNSVSLTMLTAGYVTNAGTEVSFWVPFTRYIVGSPTVTVASGNGFILRQNNAYTHGSSATVYTKPTSYKATVYANNGVWITATFSNTTNVINNAPIGINWNGTITFS